MNEETSRQKRNVLELSYHEDGRIRLSLSEANGKSPIAFYQETEIAIEKIDGLVKEITYYLNRINILKNPDQHLLDELKKSCQLLYNELLSQEIKSRLHTTPLINLELIIDEQLVHIPWELLFDGEKFLCEQFSMGRQVRSQGDKIAENPKGAEPKSRLNMLIIADPTEDLDVAWREGLRIYEEFQKKEDLVRIVLQSSDQVDLDFVKKNLWDYDMVHYAGHAEYDPENPNHSGWMLSDGKLLATDILRMAGGKRVMPRLVFGNACQSGYTEKWDKKKVHAQQSYGLVHAFLMAGVQHYIGTFCDVPDEYGACMGIEFYRHLLSGHSIGESLRKARESFQKNFGRASFSWINYVLYGHPGDYLLSIPKKKDEQTGKMEHPKLSVHPESELTSSAVRHSPFSLPQKDRWIGTSMLVLLLLIFATLAFFLPREYLRGRPVQENQALTVSELKTQRIEELKRQIYEKLKVREEGMPSQITPAIVRDVWTSRPVVLAIFHISGEETKPVPEWVIRITDDLEKGLTRHFVEDMRIRVAERKELDRLLEEKDLELSDFSFNEQKDLFGRFLFARVMLFLTPYTSSNGLSLTYKLVDADTGEIKNIASELPLSKKVDLQGLGESIYRNIAGMIRSHYPIRGRIASVKENITLLNIGSEVGITPGDVFDVYASEDKGQIIGKIRVFQDSVDPIQAKCEILEGEGFSRGSLVEIAGR